MTNTVIIRKCTVIFGTKKIMFRTITVIVKAHPALLGIALPSTTETR